MDTLDEMERLFNEMMDSLHFVNTDEIPKIDLYMDQVTSFMDETLASASRDPGHDKVLTKTMINNYVKSGVLPPPVRKKYNMDQMVLLIVIFYLKSFLSLGDIEKLLQPIRQTASENPDRTIRELYDLISAQMQDEEAAIRDQMNRLFEASRERFPDDPDGEQDMLACYDIVGRLCVEIFIKKLYLERLLDAQYFRDSHDRGDERPKEAAGKRKGSDGT